MTLAREKYRDSWAAEKRRRFRTGYPPIGSIFDGSFWDNYNKTFHVWNEIIEKMEEIWVTPQVYSAEEYHPFYNPIPKEVTTIGLSKLFFNKKVDEIIFSSTNLGEYWREELSAFLLKYYKKCQDEERLILIFLLSYNNENQIVTDEYLFECPITWLSDLAETLT